MRYDVIIIGAGVSGSAIARELSRYQGRFCVLEKEEDVCCGTSKANSGIVHAGFDAVPGSLMAKLNVEGNERMEELAQELDVPFQRIGSLVTCSEGHQVAELEALYEQGKENKVPGLRILNQEEAFQMEPNLSEKITAALYAPTGGIVCPFTLNIALAENACVNGVEFHFYAGVQEIRKEEGGFLVKTEAGDFHGTCVVNAAGVYADQIHNMVSERKMEIMPRRGEYVLLDKEARTHVMHTLFRLPDALGKGVLVTPTVHGNLLVGPTAENIRDKEGVNTTAQGLKKIQRQAEELARKIPFRQVITSFAGLRACAQIHDFIIEEAEDADGFFDCAGIASPGLSSCPAIGHMVAQMLKEKLELRENPDFCGRRKGILRPEELPYEERRELIQKEPLYGTIICRCEMVTEGEIVDAIRRPLGAKSLDGVKRRTRAGMGRCQAGFCSPRVMEILSREQVCTMAEITKCGKNSTLILGKNKENRQEGA